MAKMKSPARRTVYDDVFRTMLEKIPRLLIPLINEAFSAHYSEGEAVTALQNEHMKLPGNKVVSDSYLQIRDRYYHMECQSSPDGTMAIRMIEYDFLIALKHVRRDGFTYTLEYPKSCVLYLRRDGDMPDYLLVHVHFPDGTICDYRTPVLKVNQYRFDEIFGRRLLYFLPYYIMRYEDRLSQIEKDEQALEDFLEEYQKLYDGLYQLKGLHQITDYELVELKQLILKIVNWVARKEEKIRKGVEEMNGRVLEFEHDILMRESEARGEIRGEKYGAARQMVTLIESLARNRKVSIEDACGMTGTQLVDYRDGKKLLAERRKLKSRG